MTVPSTILICPTPELAGMSLEKREQFIARLCGYIMGMNRENHRRWMRLVRNIAEAEAGEGFHIESYEERGGPFHRKHRAVLTNLYDNQEVYPTEDSLHDRLKLWCWFVVWKGGKPVPRSTAFDKCSEEDMRKFHGEMIDLLRHTEIQEHFWPHLSQQARSEKLEAVLRGPERDEEQQTTRRYRA